MRKNQLSEKNYYHLFNRGVDGRTVFNSKEDYDRFEAYLYLLNDADSPRAANFFTGNRQEEIFSSGRGNQLVAIGAYSFTRDHFHLLVTPLVEKGIPRFMQKITTAYTMYFNDKYQRSGSLFQGTYKSLHVHRDMLLKYFFAYIHLDPAVMFDQDWTESDELETLARSAMQYRYSSAGEYETSKFVITSPTAFPKYMIRAKDPETNLKFWLQYKNAPPHAHSKS